MGLLPNWISSSSSNQSHNPWDNQEGESDQQQEETRPLLEDEHQDEAHPESESSEPIQPTESIEPLVTTHRPSSPETPITRRLGSYASNTDDREEVERGGGIHKSPYSSFKVRLAFFLGLLLLLVSVILFLLLSISLFYPIPSLIPLQRTPEVYPLWLLVTSILLLAPGLYLFELNSSTTRAIHYSSIFLLFVSLILIFSITTLRQTDLLIGVPAVGIAMTSFAWCVGTSHLIDGIQIKYKIQKRTQDLEPGTSRTPDFILTSIPISKTQSKWKRYFKLFFAWLGTGAVTLVLLSLTFDLCLTGVDSSYIPAAGEKVWIKTRDLENSISLSSAESQDFKTLRSPFKGVPDFRLHVACEGEVKKEESKTSSWTRGGQMVFDSSKKPDKGNQTRPIKPTALVFTERGVSGQVGSEWVREMVRDGDNNDDGHLSLDRVCYFDRIGYGHSDYLSTSLSIPLQTYSLHSALNSLSLLDSDSKFLVISTGYGSLFAKHFSRTYPDLIHSQLLIDAELESTWYTSLVSSSSNLRAGFKARGHTNFSPQMFYFDLLPVLLAPLSITRFLGLITMFGSEDRILSPIEHGGASNSLRNPGGGGFRLKTGGSNLNLLATSLIERLDANQGPRSSNFQSLNSTSTENNSAKKPTAVLTSFWKLHLDLKGWGGAQIEELVRKSKEEKSLIGWWKIGIRESKGKGGGDNGDAEGLCGNELGRIWCKESVRKILANDLNTDVAEEEVGANRWNFEA